MLAILPISLKAQPCSDLKYIKLNIHFMLKSNGTGNYSEYGNGKIPASPARNGFWYAQALIDASNNQLANNQRMHLPYLNETPNPPTNIRVALSGVYFHRDDKYYYYTPSNKSSGSVNETYGVNRNLELNIYVQQDTPSVAYGGIACGLGYSNVTCHNPWIKLTGVWVSSSDIMGAGPDQMGPTMNHEIGHVLGLSHSWPGDLCQDTPNNTPSWCLNDSPENKGSNNLMDYNCWQNAITPCQLDIMHHELDNYYTRFFVCCKDYPLTAPFYIRPRIPTNKSAMLDGSWRTNKSESAYSIEINQTDAYNKVDSGNYFSQKFSGQYDLIDLARLYKFVPGNYYKIKLTVTGGRCNDSDSEEAWIKIGHSNILEQYKEWRKKEKKNQ
jgi:hypothetical protein